MSGDLGRHLSLNEGSNNSTRKHARIPAVLKVSYQSFDVLADYTENLSEDGVFIATEQELEIGSNILFEVSFPGLVKPIRLNGVVKWRRATSVNQAPGVGVKLNFSSDLERIWLRDLLLRFSENSQQEEQLDEPLEEPKEYTVLLAEDNPLTLSLFTDALQNWSGTDMSILHVVQAEDSEQAWKLLQNSEINLLIIEWRLCVQGDFDLMVSLRNNLVGERRKMPVIVVGASMLEQRQALSAGADVFLRRPFPAKGLLQTIRSLVTSR